MSADIIQFPMEAHPTGAREAIRDTLTAVNYLPHKSLEVYDHILSELWVRGFKVVPVEEGEKSLLSISDMDVIVEPSVPEGMILVKDTRAKNIVAAMIFSGAKSGGTE